MPNHDYRASSVYINNTKDYKGEKLRRWTAWTESAEMRAINNLEVTKLRRFPLYVWRSGNNECSRDYVRQRRASAKNRMFGIELITAGNAEVVQNGKRFLIEKDELFLLHNYTDVQWKTGSAGFCNKRFVCIEGAVLDATLRCLNLASVTRVKPEFPPRLAWLFKRANMLLGGPEQGN